MHNTLDIMIMESNNKYEAPIVEVIEVAVEKGFQTSGISFDEEPWDIA